MIFSMAATSAYDENEVELTIKTEPGECICIGDIISIPMNDRTFEEREITDMYRDWNKWTKGKDLFNSIRDGEWAECIVHNIHSGRIHTISSVYDDEILEGIPYTTQDYLISAYDELMFEVEHYNWNNGFEVPKQFLEDPECDLAMAMKLFYLADGYSFLQGLKSEDDDWLSFMQMMKTKIESGKYLIGEHHYRIPLTRVQRYKLKKTGVSTVFLEDI